MSHGNPPSVNSRAKSALGIHPDSPEGTATTRLSGESDHMPRVVLHPYLEILLQQKHPTVGSPLWDRLQAVRHCPRSHTLLKHSEQEHPPEYSCGHLNPRA